MALPPHNVDTIPQLPFTPRGPPSHPLPSPPPLSHPFLAPQSIGSRVWSKHRYATTHCLAEEPALELGRNWDSSVLSFLSHTRACTLCTASHVCLSGLRIMYADQNSRKLTTHAPCPSAGGKRRHKHTDTHMHMNARIHTRTHTHKQTNASGFYNFSEMKIGSTKI